MKYTYNNWLNWKNEGMKKKMTKGDCTNKYKGLRFYYCCPLILGEKFGVSDSEFVRSQKPQGDVDVVMVLLLFLIIEQFIVCIICFICLKLQLIR